MRITHKKQGFSLIETLVAVSVLVLGIVGPLTLAQMSLRSFSQVRNRIVAEYLAGEGLEIIRNIRDTALIKDPDSGLPNFVPCQSALGCYADAVMDDYFELVGPSWELRNDALNPCSANCPKIKYDITNGEYNYSTGIDTIFTRRITINAGTLNVSGANGEDALVIVEVSWPGRFLGTETVEFSNYLTDWFRF